MASLLSRRLAAPLARLASGRVYSAQAAASKSFAQSLLNYPQTKVTTLTNGLRVASEETAHSTCTIGVYIDAGSRFENDKNNGTAHFLEHMAFKGTKNRSQTQLELEVENMGAHLNAYTARESTAYYIKCFSKDAEKGVDILSDILQNSVFNPAQIESERETILRESKEVDDIPLELVFDQLHANAFQGSALGRTILGPEKNIKSITRDDLLAYVKKNYTGPRIVLAAAGGVKHDDLVRFAEKFSKLPGGSAETAVPPCGFTGSEVRIRNDKLPNAHIALAVQGASWDSPDYYPLMVASTIVGSWDRTYGGGQNLSSKLARSAAANNLAESYMSFQTSYSDTGLWGAYAVCDRESVEDFVYELQQEWMNLCTSVTDGEVARARTKLKSSLLFALDGSTPICDSIGQQLLSVGRRISPAELEARISAVDAKTVKDVANRYLFDKCVAVSCTGPIEGVPDYNRIRGQMHWLRV